MATDCIAQLRFKGDRFRKPVMAAFGAAHAGSDGEAVLLNGYYGHCCYVSLVRTLTFNAERQHALISEDSRRSFPSCKQ
jgi:hypothetical protein